VSADYFDLLGVSPGVGRFFGAAEDVRGGVPAIVLSAHVWRQQFGGRSDAVGAMVLVSAIPHAVIGVAPRDFRGVDMTAPDIWVPLATSASACSLTGRDMLDRNDRWLDAIGRLRDGATLSAAAAEIDRVAASQAGLGSATRSPLEPLLEARHGGVSRDSRLARWLTFGSALVLLIVCANAAGVAAVRALERRRELAVRMQLGATRLRLVAQVAAESLLLAAGSAGVAVLVTAWFGLVLDGFFRTASVHWHDPTTLALVAVLAGVAGLASGSLPALHAARAVRFDRIHGTTDRPWAGRMRDALLVAQVALALVLTVGAGLFVRSVQAVKRGLGYDLDRVLVATVDVERAGIRRQAEKHELFARMLERVRALPAVEWAALSTAGPLGSGQFYVVQPGGPPGGPATATPRTRSGVSVDYFATLGTRVVSGRPFHERDAEAVPPPVIVSENLAQELWPGEAVVGTCRDVWYGRPCAEVVGLTEVRRIGSLTRENAEIFVPLTMSGDVPQALFARPRGAADRAAAAVAAAMRSVSPRLPFVDVRPLEQIANAQARSWRLGAMAFGVFGAFAVLLAAVGLYAALAFAIRQRTMEIGVRISLGATPRGIASLVFRRGAVLVAAGWLLGLAAAAGLGGSVRALLYGVAPADAVTLIAGSLVLATAAIAGCLVPAWRASRIDPVVALRYE
jgi:predicted permease